MSERLHGKLVKWWADRGFGFIAPDRADNDVFAGAAAFDHAGIEVPAQRERFSFVIDTDRHGRPRATELRREGVDAAAEQVFNPPRREPVRP
jgi:cold shock CspA family protein